jgi:DNA-binding NarL/FixJ family response regulator
MVLRSSAPRLVVIDDNRLRQASVASFIANWAADRSFEVRQIRTADVLTEFQENVDFGLVLLSVGSGSVRTAEISSVVRILTALAPMAPVIVISDNAAPDEIIAAYQMKCRGYVPTDMEPTLAIQVLGFILDGGTYFPPEALQLATKPRGHGPAETPDDGRKQTSNGPAPKSGSGGREARPTPRLEAAGESRGHMDVGSNDGRESSVPRHDDCGASHACVDDGSLTPRQIQVLNSLVRGQRNKLIARELGMTEGTVKVHVRQIMRKLGATNRTQVAVLASTKAGLADDDEIPPASIIATGRH